MKKAKFNSKMLMSLILLAFAFFGVFNVTYSYFTSMAFGNGSLDFPDINVRFFYRETERSDIVTLTTLTTPLYPTASTIARGETFGISLSNTTGTPLNTIGIRNMEGSCEVYIRFWLDVYIVDANGNPTSQINYGKYFLFTEESSYITNEGGSVANSWCYFAVESLLAGWNVGLGNSLMLSEEAPAELLGKSIKINLSFEAVQQANEAYRSVFGQSEDTKGYYTRW